MNALDARTATHATTATTAGAHAAQPSTDTLHHPTGRAGHDDRAGLAARDDRADRTPGPGADAVASSPHAARAFRRIRRLIRGYVTVSVLTLAVAAALHGHASVVTPAVWIRGTLVAAGGVVMALCAARAARGSRGAYRRLRVLSAVTLAAIAAIVALPGVVPGWMRIEQAACGLVLAAAVAVVNSRAVREPFSVPPAVTARS